MVSDKSGVCIMASGTPLRSKGGKEDIGQNIQVFARCRPLNQAERDKKSFSIVDLPSAREILVKEKLNSNMTKSYQFDRVFGPKSVQLDVYKAVVQPLIDQVDYIYFLLLLTKFPPPCVGDDGIQLHGVCLRPDWHGQDLHHGGRRQEERPRVGERPDQRDHPQGPRPDLGLSPGTGGHSRVQVRSN